MPLNDRWWFFECIYKQNINFRVTVDVVTPDCETVMLDFILFLTQAESQQEKCAYYLLCLNKG